MIFILQIAPRILARDEVRALSHTAMSLVRATLDGDAREAEELVQTASAQGADTLRKLIRVSLYVFPFVALLTVILLMVANRDVKDRQSERRSPPFVAYIALCHVAIAVVKLTAFLFCVVPGVYLYVKLFFVSLVMIERRAGVQEAIRMSWRMTDGHFWPVFAVVLLNTAIQTASAITILGVIPATGFANTARAAAFRMLLEPAAPPSNPRITGSA